MNVLQYLRSGFHRTVACRSVVLSLYTVNLALALVPTFVLFQEIEASLSDSFMAETMSSSYDDNWFKEFSADAVGIGATFHPSVTGIGAILNGLDDHVSGQIFSTYLPLVSLGCLYALIWIFASAGLLVGFEAKRPRSFAGFVSDSASLFGRFFRIAAIVAVGYALLFGVLKPGAEDLLESFLREEIDERVVFGFTLGKYLLLGFGLVLLNMISDYTKISTVLENRQSVLLAMLRSLRLCLSQPFRVIALYLLLVLLGLLMLLTYSMIAPGASQQSWAGILFALALGQLYILGRVWLRVLFLGSQFGLFRDLRGEALT